MLIIGANGHAKEMLEIFRENGSFTNLCFFDNVSFLEEKYFYGFPIIDNFDDASKLFRVDTRFSMGIGKPILRYDLTTMFQKLGGEPTTLISGKALIANDTNIKAGVNIMPFVSVYNSVSIGSGALINSYASLHHDCTIGDFCEISPGARILGGCNIGELCSIGTNAVILPKIKIAGHVIIGAGSVVTKDISEPGVYYGVPAKKILGDARK